MTLSDEQWRFAVEELVGVTPAECQAIVARAERQGDAARAIARNLLLRATISGGASGLGSDRWRAVPLLMEERAALRQKALLRASLAYLDDRTFFLRRDWPQHALGLDGEGRTPMVLVRETIRFVVRAVVMYGTRAATSSLPGPLPVWSCASAGAIFNAIEHTGFATRLLEARQERATDVRTTGEGAVVLTLPVRRDRERDNAPTTEKRS
jgi:hypothetical protein